MTSLAPSPRPKPRRRLSEAERMARDLERETAKAQENEAKRAECLASFAAFVDHVLCDKKGNALPPCAYSTLLADTLVYAHARKQYLALMGPPGVGKSTLIRLFFVWCLGIDPTLATVVISADKSTASKHVRACRSMFLHSRVRHVFPDLEPDINTGDFKGKGKGLDAKGWTGDRFHFRTTNTSSPHPAMEASPASPKTEDRRVDMLDGDDLMSLVVNNSPAMRQQVIDSVTKTWLYGRLSNLGWPVLTHNCWSRLDLLHQLLDDTRFLHVWAGVDADPAGPSGDCERMFVWVKGAAPDFPMLANPAKYEAIPFDPPAGWQCGFTIPLPQGREEWSPEFLRGRRDNPKTAADFAQFHGLRAQTPEDLVFPGWEARAAIQATAAGLGKLGDGRDGFPSADALDRAQRYTFAGGLDLSGDTRDGTVLTILARNQQRRIFPIFHRRYRDVLEVMADIQRLWDQGIHFIRLAVENNAVQSQIVGVMKSDAAGRAYPWRHRVQGFQTGKQKMDPDIGLPSMDALIRGGEIVWPAMEANNPANPKAADWRRWEREMGSITRAEVKARGKTPDSVMSFWFALSALDGIGFAGQERGVSGGVRANPALDSALGW